MRANPGGCAGPPPPPAPPYDLIARAQAVKRKQPGRMLTVGAVGLTTVFLLGCSGVVIGLVNHRAGTALGTLTVLALAATAGAMGLIRAYHGRLKSEVKAALHRRRRATGSRGSSSATGSAGRRTPNCAAWRRIFIRSPPSAPASGSASPRR